MLPTPDTSHVPFEKIYEPAEDSYLLLDTLSSPSESAFLKDRFDTHGTAQGGTNSGTSATGLERSPPLLALEVGTGSGVVLAFLTAHAEAILGNASVLTLGTDVNEHACLAARSTVSRAASDTVQSPTSQEIVQGRKSLFLDNVVADLASPIREHMLDILIFNPPYVPTDRVPALPSLAVSRTLASGLIGNEDGELFERESQLLSLSYAGGTDGMETTERLLTDLPHLLNERRGVAYVLLCAQNKPDEVKWHIRSWGDEWNAETIRSSGKQGGWEKLQTIRIWQTRTS